MLPTIRLSSYAVETASRAADKIRPYVRMHSPAVTMQCREAGLPADLAELCAGLLASLIDDLIAIPKLPRTDFERTKRKERILAVAHEPYSCALKLAMAASPLNGRAAVTHWDAICDKPEVGKLAWLLGMDTEAAYGYGRKMEKLQNSA